MVQVIVVAWGGGGREGGWRVFRDTSGKLILPLSCKTSQLRTDPTVTFTGGLLLTVRSDEERLAFHLTRPYHTIGNAFGHFGET